MSESSSKPILNIRDLVVEFKTEAGVIRALDGISFEVGEGEALGIVGESGCGKSVTALSILRLIPNPPGRIAGGSIELDGIDVVSQPEDKMRKVRGSLASMIFQEPMTALNPVFTIGNQMVEVIRVHQKISKADAKLQAIEMLRTVNIESPEKRIDQYPHELSGPPPRWMSPCRPKSWRRLVVSSVK
jgi:peptide/nickel transport system ATP-binding protein